MLSCRLFLSGGLGFVAVDAVNPDWGDCLPFLSLLLGPDLLPWTVDPISYILGTILLT